MTWPPSSHRQYKPPNQISDLYMRSWLTSAPSWLLPTFTTEFSILPAEAAPRIPSGCTLSLPNLRQLGAFAYHLCGSDYGMWSSCPAIAPELQIPISEYLLDMSQKIQIPHIAPLTPRLLTTHLIFRVDGLTTAKLPKLEKPRLPLTHPSSSSCMLYD